jgi:hypothetical protein
MIQPYAIKKLKSEKSAKEDTAGIKGSAMIIQQLPPHFRLHGS